MCVLCVSLFYVLLGLIWYFEILVEDVLTASSLFWLDGFYYTNDEKKRKLIIFNGHFHDKIYASARQLNPIA